MGRETESEDTVDAPTADETPGSAAADSGTTWPTWEDIARLHRVPGKDGSPPPQPVSEQPAPPPVADAEPADGEVDEAVPDDGHVDEAVPARDRADEEAGETEPDEVALDEVAPEEPSEPVGAVEPDDSSEPEPAAPDDATQILPPIAAAQDPVVSDDETVLMAAVVEPAPTTDAPDEVQPADADGESDEQPAEAEPEPEPADAAPSEQPADADAAEPEVDAAEPEVVAAESEVVAAEPEVVAAEPEAAAPAADPAVPDDETTVLSPVPAAVPVASGDETVAVVPARVSVFPATSSAPSAGPRITAGPVPLVGRMREADMLDVFPEQRHPRQWPRNLAIAAGVVVLLGGGYLAACYALGDRVPRGATVAGVDIGGLSSAEAVARLDAELAAATDRPLDIVAQDVHAQIDPVAAGLSFDPRATVDGLTGVRPADPGRLWTQVVGLGEIAPKATVDTAKLQAALASVAGSLRADPVDGAIVFADGTAHATPAADGWEVDQAGSVARIAETWLVGARPVELPVVPVEPAITQAETDRALTQVAQNVPAGPVSLAVTGRSATLTGAQIAAAASFVPQDGALVLTLDGQALTDDVLTQLPDLLTPAADAHFEFQDDHPVIVPGVPGTRLDPAAVAQAVAAAASRPTGRQASVDLSQTDPAQSTAALEALGVTQVVGEFATPLTSDHIRDINIRQGLANITGVLVRPGEEFGLTDALGPIDAEHGFVEAGAIVNGEHTDAWGGGLSQVSTTTYNAAYLAGMEIVEHHPHSEWFSRYPEGREATIFTGTLDMRWKNNTPYGALVQGWVSDGKAHVRIWGSPYWTVESSTSARSNVRATTTVYSQSPTCQPQKAGNPGFTVTVTRTTYLGADLKDTESWTTTYRPQNQIVCGPPPPDTPPTG